MHEHVIAINWSMRQVFDKWIDRDGIISRAIQSLLKAKEYGLKTIVDATPINLGRDIHIISEVAKKSGVQIIAATGLYSVDEPFLMGWEPDRIAELLLIEVNEGIQGTGIKPGIIKCATEASEVSDTNRKLLQATARLHKETGLPITTHSNSLSKNGPKQQKILLDEGVDPKKLIIGHCGDTTDVNYIESILDKGCYVGLDRFGVDMWCPMKARADTLVELCDKGYEKQIVLSHDYNSHIDWWPSDILPEFKRINAPRWSYHHIMEDVIPYLKNNGISNNQISTIMIENPKQVFSWRSSEIGFVS
jgi:phosphotriesterase-related protein